MKKWSDRPQDYGRPDVWQDINNMLPSMDGSYRTAPVFATITGAGPSSPGTTLNAWLGVTPAEGVTYYVGTTTKLYRAASIASFTDSSKSGGYTSSAQAWSFSQFGNYTVATNGVDAPQVRDATTANAFADLGGTPPSTAKIAVVQSNVLLFFNTNSGGASWAASDVGNHANFTTGEAASGAIHHRPGAITAAVAFKDEVIVFKGGSVYRMRYVGSPIFWLVELIADGIGVGSQGAVCNCGDSLVIMSVAGAYLFDGASFRKIEAPSVPLAASASLKEGLYVPHHYSVWFQLNNIIYVYNLASDRWGKFEVYKTSASTSTDTYRLVGGPIAARIGVASGVMENLIYMIDLASNPCVVSSSGAWGSQSGTVSAYLHTAYIGNRQIDSTFTRLIPAAKDHELGGTETTTMTLTPYVYTSPRAGAATAKSNVSASSDVPRFDFTYAAKFMSFKIAVSAGPTQIEDVIVESKPAGAT